MGRLRWYISEWSRGLFPYWACKSPFASHWRPLLAFRTETIKKTLDPSWQPFRLSLFVLNNGIKTRPLLWEVYDWNSNGSHELIGSFEAPMTRIAAGGMF